MPTSNLAVAPAVINLIETSLPHDWILDVGPGFGKYSVLLREYLNVKPSQIHAVEMWPEYVTDRLRCMYDAVFINDVCEMESFDAYDMVLMADVIEHIEKEKALELLSRINCRVIVSTPEHFFHTDEGLPPTEEHVSHWTLDDFGARVEANASYLGGLIVRLGPLS